VASLARLGRVNHLWQAQGLVGERKATDGCEADRVRPLVEGMAEAMPWVRMRHHEIGVRPEPGGRLRCLPR
jgi:hypothetical protein